MLPAMVWRAAVRIAYDGREFMGSQRQPIVRTVEGEVISALRDIKAIDDPERSRFKVASRTDRGVSALGNVIAFDTDFQRGKLLQALNAAADKVYYLALAEVASSFTPRRATARWYRYFLPAEGLDEARLRSCALSFEGKHDFRRFCKPDGKSTTKRIDRIGVFPIDQFFIIDIHAREFLRNMVRRMVAAMAAVASKASELTEVEDVLSGRDKSFGLATPENLWLMEIQYPFEFELQFPATLKRRVIELQRGAFLDLAFAEALSRSSGESDQERGDLAY